MCLLIALLTMTAEACSDSPTAPQVGGPSISCPAAVNVASPTGLARTVTFDAPVALGESPLSTTCSPASGSNFDVGTTQVTCTARDAHARTASCSFQVTVAGPPRTSATKFLAFGDSITSGVIATDCQTFPTLSIPFTPAMRALERQRLLADLESSPGVSYPSVLASLLSSRYTAQQMVVTNAGEPSEEVSEHATTDRFAALMTSAQPQVVLLLEGINDINARGSTAIPDIVNGLQTMIRTARQRNAAVLLATLLPERFGNPLCRAFDWADGINDIAPANVQIKAMAAREGATVVDLYPLFEPRVSTLLGIDGLHPNAAGYQLMAQTFFSTVQQLFETSHPAPALSSVRRR